MKVLEYVPLVLMALLVNVGLPVDCTLCESDIAAQVHVTVPPTATVSTAGFDEPLRPLVNTIPAPTVTAAVIGTVTAVAWNVTGEPVSPVLVAVMVLLPAVPPSVTVAWAVPVASVGPLAGVTIAEPEVTNHLTVTPDTPLPNWSLTFTWSGFARLELTAPVWLSPLTKVSRVAAPGVAVAVKVTGDPVAPLKVAVAVWVPAVWPNVQVALDIPMASVAPEFAGLTAAPVPEVAHVTVVPTCGVPLNVTTTRSGLARAVVTAPV